MAYKSRLSRSWIVPQSTCPSPLKRKAKLVVCETADPAYKMPKKKSNRNLVFMLFYLGGMCRKKETNESRGYESPVSYKVIDLESKNDFRGLVAVFYDVNPLIHGNLHERIIYLDRLDQGSGNRVDINRRTLFHLVEIDVLTIPGHKTLGRLNSFYGRGDRRTVGSIPTIRVRIKFRTLGRRIGRKFNRGDVKSSTIGMSLRYRILNT